MTAAELLVAIEGAPAWSVAFVHDGAPQAKQRARVVMTRGRARAYTPPATEAAETALAWRWKLALQGRTYDGPLAIACVFYRPDRRRVDVDNLIKTVLDSGNRARAWLDDSQVVCIVARLELDAERPRTEVALAPTSSSLARITPSRR